MTKGSMKKPVFKSIVMLAVYVLAVAAGGELLAGPKVFVGQRTAGRLSFDSIEHASWNALLQAYVDEQGKVAYARWKRTSQDQQRLDAYLKHLSQANPAVKSSKEAKLAFWINAYNAVTIKGILREFPTSSIRNHTPKLWGYHIWKDLQLYVGGRAYSLEQIEHEVLRKMGEPRIHFAIVCASHSCPRLLNEAYVANRFESQITTNTRAFFANPGNFRYDARSNTFQLSSILTWFATDFGANSAAILRRIAPYLPDETSRRAAAAGRGRVSYLPYDWSLNGQAPPRSARRR